MEKVAFNEMELAKRWGVSPKTLQRWRCEGRGPKYLKLSKRVTYPLDEILDYEYRALHESTWKRGSDVVVTPNAKLRSAREIAAATSLPMYVLTHPKVREALGVPCIRVGKLVRFNLEEVMSWARRMDAEMKEHGIEDTSDPTEDKRSLLQVIGNLAA